jgi:serine protease Do
VRRRVFALLLCLSVARPSSAQSAADHTAIARAIAAVYPSLVRIAVVTMNFDGGREIKHEAFGSGTIISADGYVVTNHHVAGRVRRITCTLPDKQEIPADLVGTDPLADIAVIKLRPEKPRTFSVAHFGDSSRLQRGDPVLAMGSPLALSQSVTSGIVSNTEIILPHMLGTLNLDGEDVGTIVRWIGHDAAIYPGNSGGPLVNLSGEIVGVNEIGIGLSAAIPIDLVKPVIAALIRDGHVRRSWTGIQLQPLISGTAGSGGLVSWIANESPAAAAGLKAGDVLVRVNDTPVEVRFAEQLPAVNRLLLTLPIGQAARFVVRRGSSDKTVSVTPVERAVASIPAEVRSWGLVATNMSAFEARDMGRRSTDGVRVMSIRAGKPAEQARPPLGHDDVIVEIDGQPVRSVAELEARTDALVAGKPKASVLVAFDRDRERRLTVVELAASEPEGSRTEASKAWIPIDVQALTPQLAERLGLKGRTGVRVTRVRDEATTLRVGDVILAIDRDRISASGPTDDDVFAVAVRRYAIGATVTLTVSRGGAEMPLPITLGASPHLPREMDRYEDPDFEFRVRDIASADREDPRMDSMGTGVFVDTVTEGGWAALSHLIPKDIILTVDGHAVASVAELAAQMKAVDAGRPSVVVFGIRRGVRTMFIEMKPTWK